MNQDLYRVLDLPPAASAADIRAAYSRILQQVASRASRRDPADLERLERARDAYRTLLPAAARR
ncbi:MAG TPA: hypothetical protein VFY24_10415 [Azospira sp.]|nr:hypothetical protein [Azospira sp.]